MVDIREGLAAVLTLRAHSSGLDQRCIDFQSYKRAAADFITVHGEALEAALAQQAGAVAQGRVNGYLLSARAIEVIVDGDIPEWMTARTGLRVTIASSGPGGGGEVSE